MQGITPYIEINTEAVEHNAKVVSGWCVSKGIDLWGVTKVARGDVKVATAMLRGGCIGLADSRIQNLKNLRQSFPEARLMCIRTPGNAQLVDLVGNVDISLQSDLGIIENIGRIAVNTGKTHSIILMMELGDLREGIPFDDYFDMFKKAIRIEGINVIGIGGILTCLSGVKPTEDNLGMLLKARDSISDELGIDVQMIAGGSSGVLPMLIDSSLPEGINEFHVGESIVLGTDALTGEPLHPDLRVDAFTFFAEVIECYRKPSKPEGKVVQKMTGEVPEFDDLGKRDRAILNFGLQDTNPAFLTPLKDGVTLIDASSDHAVADVEGVAGVKVGDILAFRPSYAGLLHMMDSEYVEKRYTEDLDGT
jgi:ornithine racemase